MTKRAKQQKAEQRKQLQGNVDPRREELGAEELDTVSGGLEPDHGLTTRLRDVDGETENGI